MSFEIETIRPQGWLEQYNNCQGTMGYVPAQQLVQYCYCSPPRDLHAFEIVIEQLSTDSEPQLNYGAKLRLLMADPIKGHDLRDAVQKLKLALKEAIKHATSN